MSKREPHYDHYSMIIEWSDGNDAFIVTVPERPGCRTHGLTYQDAVQQGQDAIESWIDAARASGHIVPKARLFAESEFIEAVQQGIEAYQRGEVVSHAEVVARFEQRHHRQGKE